jgi:hypothetical protein
LSPVDGSGIDDAGVGGAGLIVSAVPLSFIGCRSSVLGAGHYSFGYTGRFS